jgi:TolB protein
MKRQMTCAIALGLALLGGLGIAGGPVAQAAETGSSGRIAYRRYLNAAQTHGALFTIKPDGSGLRQITHPRRGTITDEPEWSPNGQWILYQAEDRHGSRLYKIRRNGSSRTHLSTDCGNRCGDGYASWFPGGRRLAFQRETCGTGSTNLIAIYVMRADGTRARRVTHKRATCATRHRYEDGAPALAPSGKRLAFERIDHKRGRLAIFIVHLDGAGLRRVTPWRIAAAQPNWSPNGRWIAFRTQEQSETEGNIALVHPNGRGLHRITRGHGEYKWLSCSFSPRGNRITAGRVPGSGPDDNADVYIMKIDGSDRRNLTKSPQWESAPDWGPRRRRPPAQTPARTKQ